MLNLKRVAFVAMMTTSIMASAQNLTTQGVVGNVVGGLIGAYAGSKVGQGNGRTVAIAAGTMLGSYVGGRVSGGNDQRNDQRQYNDQSSYNQQSYQQPVRQSGQQIMSSREAASSYNNNELIPYEDSRSQRPQVRQVRQMRDTQQRQRFEKYYYTVQSESGRQINMVGCAAYDEREQANRQVDMRNCDSQQVSYTND